MALWYFTRASGAVSLVLLTLTLVLGVVDVNRWFSPRFPRFLVDGVHRTVSLLVVLFVALHVFTAVLDSFAPVRLVDAVIPFGAAAPGGSCTGSPMRAGPSRWYTASGPGQMSAPAGCCG
jgi:sulfoxide reductase heme-binding subunit YedZ